MNVEVSRTVAVCALVVGSLSACGGGSPGSGGEDSVDQSDPASFSTGVVEAARNGQDVARYAISDRKTGTPCASTTACDGLKSLATVSGTCARLKGELTAHVESANRSDDASLVVHITTPDDSSGFCSMHVSEVNDKWWLSD